MQISSESMGTGVYCINRFHFKVCVWQPVRYLVQRTLNSHVWLSTRLGFYPKEGKINFGRRADGRVGIHTGSHRHRHTNSHRHSHTHTAKHTQQPHTAQSTQHAHTHTHRKRLQGAKSSNLDGGLSSTESVHYFVRLRVAAQRCSL